MYTVDDKYSENNVEEEYEDNNSSWDNGHGLVVKIIIIVLCVIVLIWLISALKNNNYVDDGKVHSENVEKVRLAAEKYFFINGNAKDKGSQTISLQTLRNNGLVSEIVDANEKVCSESNSNVSLTRDVGPYEMVVKLACSTNDKEETFYYHNNTLACLNCDGNTNMDGNNGSKVVPVDNDTKKEDIDYNNYSCKTWTSWSTNRISETYLTERTRKLYKGVKYGKEIESIVYGEWSEYQTTPIEATDTIEVETETKNEMVWSDPKTTTNSISNSDTIQVININTVSGVTKKCPKGSHEENGVCYEEKETVGDLSYSEYNSGKYHVTNGLCESVKTEKVSDGRYDLVYKNCHYTETVEVSKVKKSTSYTEYTYQELENREVTYYRFREKNTVTTKEDDVYTSEYYEESNLPTGYVKLPSTEKVEYSYKITTCEK